MNCKFLAYVLSQYLWVLILGLTLISTIQFKKPIPTGDIISNSDAPYFDQNQDPIWFLHFTDIHLSSKKGNYPTILERFNYSLSLFSPDHIAITGDIADNYRGNKNPIYYQQMEEDWNLYTQLLTDLDRYFNDNQSIEHSNSTEQNSDYRMTFLKNPLHVAGNHDIFNIYSYDSKRHFAEGILYNKSTNIISSYTFDSNITFVKINPFSFPSATSAIIWWISPEKRIRSEINNFLGKLWQKGANNNIQYQINQNRDSRDKNYKQTIVLCHIPARMWFPTFSTTLSNPTNNVKIYLSGHLHPKKPQILHHGQSIEVVGTPLFRYNQVGLASLDNGHFSYHQMNLSHKKFAILTFPNPDQTRSSLERFDENLERTGIRAVSFSGDMNLSFRIDNGQIQRLKCAKRLKYRKSSSFSEERYNQNIFLCTEKPVLDPSVPIRGKHVFTKLGDWEGNFTFTVGEKIESFNEECYFDEASGSYIACFFLYLVFLLMVLLPLKFVHFADRFDDWLEIDLIKSNNVVVNGNLNWILATVGGFFVVQTRVAKSPLFIRIVLNVALLWSFVFPFCFFKIENNLAVFWLWGFIVGKKSDFMAIPTRFGVFYLTFVLAPVVIVVSGMQHTFSLFSRSGKREVKKGENEMRERLNDANDNKGENLSFGGGCATASNDAMFSSSETEIVGVGPSGVSIADVESLTSFKRKCVVMNIVEVVLYFACFYQCFEYAKELAKDFGDLFGFSSFIFVVIPALLLVMLTVWIVTTSLRIYRHRFDFTVSAVPLGKDQL